jgi:uncharacterized membrane protein YhaH (DUF805 family)
MEVPIGDLVRPTGRISRARFFAWGLVLAAIKIPLDYLVTEVWFERGWSPWLYVAGDLRISTQLDTGDTELGLALAAVAIPFVAAGIVLTIQRLRDAAWPVELAVLFVAPVVNYLLFVGLCVTPSVAPRPAEPDRDDVGGETDASSTPLAPRSFLALAAITTPIWVGLVVLVAWPLLTFARFDGVVYGWGLFIGLPILLGVIAERVAVAGRRPHVHEAMAVALCAYGMAGALLCVFALEGLICIAMATPIVLGASFLGVVIARVARNTMGPDPAAAALCVVLPLGVGAEHAVVRGSSGRLPPTRTVRTSVVVDAPAGVVWDLVVRFPEISPPDEFWFRAGIAYPQRARIEGEGVGAVRYCEFTTGAFVEPIEVWDPPRLLRFGVVENPPPMTEWTLWGHLDAPHLHDHFVATHGEFRLEELADGRTALHGTTEYRQHLWPQAYWSLWSDAIVHSIHRRVLDHIAARAEGR